MIFKVVGKHREKCLAREKFNQAGWRPHPWSTVIDGGKFGARNTPLRRGYIRWARVPCNDPECEAALYFRVDEAIRKAPK